MPSGGQGSAAVGHKGGGVEPVVAHTGVAAEFVPIHGAEAVVSQAQYLGRAVLSKHRIAKPYRIAQLDARLRDERTRDEANLLLAARRAGVPVPIVYDIDRAGGTLLIERIDGTPLRLVLERDDAVTAAARLRLLGTLVARLHDGGVTHGDLTTSNILVPTACLNAPTTAPGLVLIDFGLGQSIREEEPRGVDLHLLEEALEATEPRAHPLFAAFLEGYTTARADGGSQATLRRLDDIRERGRYR